jgi:hypothetical protein
MLVTQRELALFTIRNRTYDVGLTASGALMKLTLTFTKLWNSGVGELVRSKATGSPKRVDSETV